MNVTVDVHTAHVQLTNLYKYTLYDIYVTVRTKWDGPKSETITVSTDEGSMFVYLFLFYLSAQHYKGCRRRSRLMVSVPDSGSSGPGFEPWPGHCVLFLGKTLYSHSASLHLGV